MNCKTVRVFRERRSEFSSEKVTVSKERVIVPCDDLVSYRTVESVYTKTVSARFVAFTRTDWNELSEDDLTRTLRGE